MTFCILSTHLHSRRSRRSAGPSTPGAQSARRSAVEEGGDKERETKNEVRRRGTFRGTKEHDSPKRGSNKLRGLQHRQTCFHTEHWSPTQNLRQHNAQTRCFPQQARNQLKLASHVLHCGADRQLRTAGSSGRAQCCTARPGTKCPVSCPSVGRESAGKRESEECSSGAGTFRGTEKQARARVSKDGPKE